MAYLPSEFSPEFFITVMKHFMFWYKWLLAVSMLFTFVGIFIALFPNSFLFDLHTDAISKVFFDGTFPEEAVQLRSFLFAPIGGTIAGYFLLQIFIIRHPFYNRESWSWHAILWPLMLWFVVDSGMSIYHGAFFNVWMVNIWTLILVGLPLLMTRRAFNQQTSHKMNDEQIIKRLKKFAQSFDKKDWNLMQECLAQKLWVDYSSLRKTEPAEVSRSKYIEQRKEGLKNLETTHLLKNFEFKKMKKNSVQCRCDFEINRFSADNSDDYFHSSGAYHFTLTMIDGQWRIQKITQIVTKNRGNKSIHGAFK